MHNKKYIKGVRELLGTRVVSRHVIRIAYKLNTQAAIRFCPFNLLHEKKTQHGCSYKNSMVEPVLPL
jgi:hypothetical protein